jgi:outer membrane immunogenic protein
MGERHMKKILLASVAAMAFCAAPALGADMPVKAPPLTAPFSWAGFYVGAYVGGEWGNTHVRRFDGATEFNPIDANPSGVGIGGLVGYNLQNGQTVFGLESDAGWLNAKATNNQFSAGGLTVPVKIDFEGRIRGRFGYAIDRALFFIAGGVSFGHEMVTLNEPGFATPSVSKDHVGWNIGAGLDYAFLNNWIGRVEYIYDAFSNPIYGFSAASGGAFADRRAKFDTNTVRAALIMKF